VILGGLQVLKFNLAMVFLFGILFACFHYDVYFA